MSFSYEIVTRLRKTVGSEQGEWETLSSRSLSDLTEAHDATHQVSSETVTLWDASLAGSLASFAALLIVSDQPVELELTCNEGDANEELSHVSLARGVPFMLGEDAARYNYTTDAFAGTLDVIDKARVKENDGLTASVRIVILR